MGLTFDNTYYLEAQQAHFNLVTTSTFAVPHDLQTAPMLALSGDSYFPLATGLPHEQSCHWPATATGGGKEGLFHFQHEPHAAQIACVPASHSTVSTDTPPISVSSVASPISPTLTAERSPYSTTHSSPILTAGNSSVASWTPSPPPALLLPPRSKKGGRGPKKTTVSSTVSRNAAITRAEEPDGKKKPNPTKSRRPASTKVSTKLRDTERPKGPLNPSNFDTLEEYQTELRLWHNRIGKKYRTKLNYQFECLHVVLYPEEEDNDVTPPRGRTINKARTLDMARQRILDLTHENNVIRAELEQMQRLMLGQ